MARAPKKAKTATDKPGRKRSSRVAAGRKPAAAKKSVKKPAKKLATKPAKKRVKRSARTAPNVRGEVRATTNGPVAGAPPRHRPAAKKRMPPRAKAGRSFLESVLERALRSISRTVERAARDVDQALPPKGVRRRRRQLPLRPAGNRPVAAEGTRTRRIAAAVPGVALRGPLAPRYRDILTAPALSFLAMLHRRFEPQRRALPAPASGEPTTEPEAAVEIMRPRGWRAREPHVTVDGEPIAAALFDFGLDAFHKAAAESGQAPDLRVLLAQPVSPREAQLWNDLFEVTEEALGLPPRTIKVIFPAAFAAPRHAAGEGVAGLQDRIVRPDLDPSEEPP